MISLPTQTEIAVTQSVVYFIAAIIPIYLTVARRKISNDNKHFKRLTTVLASFVLLQGVYPAASYFWLQVNSKSTRTVVVWYTHFQFSTLLARLAQKQRKLE